MSELDGIKTNVQEQALSPTLITGWLTDQEEGTRYLYSHAQLTRFNEEYNVARFIELLLDNDSLIKKVLKENSEKVIQLGRDIDEATDNTEELSKLKDELIKAIEDFEASLSEAYQELKDKNDSYNVLEEELKNKLEELKNKEDKIKISSDNQILSNSNTFRNEDYNMKYVPITSANNSKEENCNNLFNLQLIKKIESTNLTSRYYNDILSISLADNITNDDINDKDYFILTRRISKTVIHEIPGNELLFSIYVNIPTNVSNHSIEVKPYIESSNGNLSGTDALNPIINMPFIESDINNSTLFKEKIKEELVIELDREPTEDEIANKIKEIADSMSMIQHVYISHQESKHNENWQRIKIAFVKPTLAEGEDLVIGLLINANVFKADNTLKIYTTDWKLQRGNILTDWCLKEDEKEADKISKFEGIKNDLEIIQRKRSELTERLNKIEDLIVIISYQLGKNNPNAVRALLTQKGTLKLYGTGDVIVAPTITGENLWDKNGITSDMITSVHFMNNNQICPEDFNNYFEDCLNLERVYGGLQFKNCIDLFKNCRKLHGHILIKSIPTNLTDNNCNNAFYNAGADTEDGITLDWYKGFVSESDIDLLIATNGPEGKVKKGICLDDSNLNLDNLDLKIEIDGIKTPNGYFSFNEQKPSLNIIVREDGEYDCDVENYSPTNGFHYRYGIHKGSTNKTIQTLVRYGILKEKYHFGNQIFIYHVNETDSEILFFMPFRNTNENNDNIEERFKFSSTEYNVVSIINLLKTFDISIDDYRNTYYQDTNNVMEKLIYNNRNNKVNYSYLLSNNHKITKLPWCFQSLFCNTGFEINAVGLFNGCEELLKINKYPVTQLGTFKNNPDNIFNTWLGHTYIREIPKEFDFASNQYLTNFFADMLYLKKIPDNFLDTVDFSMVNHHSVFGYCQSLKEGSICITTDFTSYSGDTNPLDLGRNIGYNYIYGSYNGIATGEALTINWTHDSAESYIDEFLSHNVEYNNWIKKGNKVAKNSDTGLYEIVQG